MTPVLDSKYSIVDKNDAYYVNQGLMEVGPFFSIKAARKWIKEDVKPHKGSNVIEMYNGQGIRIR